jgi:hypothetical protein
VTGKSTRAVFKAIGRHFVTLSFDYVPPGKTLAEKRSGVVSGFVVEIDRIWFYVTAGHVIDELREGLRIGGKFDRWRLDDQTAGNQFKGAAVPYDFSLERWFVLRDDDIGMDYAATPLSPLYRENLKAGGVIPIVKEAWGRYPLKEYHEYALMGVPAETVINPRQGFVEARVMMIPLEPVDAPPSAGKTAQNMFFAKLKFDATGTTRPESIKGMSGGPIFGLRKIEGQRKYWIVGVQSGWYENLLIVSVCPFPSFALAIEKQLMALRADGVLNPE